MFAKKVGVPTESILLAAQSGRVAQQMVQTDHKEEIHAYRRATPVLSDARECPRLSADGLGGKTFLE